jgi:hypothetical protein
MAHSRATPEPSMQNYCRLGKKPDGVLSFTPEHAETDT